MIEVPERCPPKLLTFLGHGNPSAPCWFLGMEEGIDEQTMTLSDNLQVRLQQFGPIMDLHESVRLLGSPITLQRRPPTSTWPWMAKILRGLVERADNWSDRDHARRFIFESLGKSDGCSFIAELLPLPNKSDKAWPLPYNTWWPTRQAYERDVLPKRVELLRTAIGKYAPKWVIAHGKRHHDAFKLLFAEFHWREIGRLTIGTAPGTGTIAALTPFFGNGVFGECDAASLIEILAANPAANGTARSTGSP